MSSHDLEHIQRLTGESTYGIWSEQTKTILLSRGVWRHVERRVPEPIKESDEFEHAFRNRLKFHEMDASQAIFIIQKYLPKTIMTDLRYLKTAFDIWQHLKKKYEPPGLTDGFSAYQEWQLLTYDGTDLEDFIDKYTYACARLKGTPVDVNDAVKLYRFITMISPWFHAFAANFRASLRSMKSLDELPSLESVIAGLLDEERAVSLYRSAYMARAGKAHRA